MQSSSETLLRRSKEEIISRSFSRWKGGGLPLSNTNADDAVINAFNAAFTASIKSSRDISTVQISQVHLLCQDWTQYFEAEGLQLQHYGMLVPNSDRAGENSVLPGINGVWSFGLPNIYQQDLLYLATGINTRTLLSRVVHTMQEATKTGIL
ncbi:hypothetical protein AnigIFM63604_006979 [Aspergillus niger]|uniref:Uncharacterized protein n=1 Tax=Aspergillus niger TaxID=5061 RepID=A0A9W6EA78_ASPNG|nr:hypothetical protein AnigIFM63604_006979 [Aspergillus niger]